METIVERRRQRVGESRKFERTPRVRSNAHEEAGRRTARPSRVLDLVFGAPILLAITPLLALVALAISMERGGPILYSQERLGYRGRRFRMLKFRTMIPNAERDTGPVWSERGDTRVTRVGRFLRGTHLDELPQILNVLRGEMSLVGPRPERPSIAVWLDTVIEGYWRRLDVAPGITGLAQIRTGYDTSVDSVRRKLRYDLFYIRRRSVGLYVAILSGTASRLIRGSWATERRESSERRFGVGLPPFAIRAERPRHDEVVVP